MSDTAFAEAEPAPNARRIVIPYVPRTHFRGLHNSTKRWKFVVAHRRAGKTVALINELIKKALLNTREFPKPRYGYVGPSFAQAKDLVWGYLKHYTLPFGDDVKFSESELSVTMPNGATISLYGGAAAFERMRGLYFDGIVLDEFTLLNPSVLSTVVRPCLADYRGWGVVSGTSDGDGHFHDVKKKNQSDPNWDFFIIPVNETDALAPEEVEEMTKDMSPEEFAREMMCSFDAPIQGSYYADLMNKADLDGRIGGVPYDPAAPVVTWWDLGISDNMPVWFTQQVGREIHVIDFLNTNGKGIPEVLQMVTGVWKHPITGETPPEIAHRQQYAFGAHVTPHDMKARELGTGKSRYEVMVDLVPESVQVIIAPSLSVEDGIQAVRSTLPICYFDKDRTEEGRSALRNYHKSPKSEKPVHNWASHPADGFRYGSIAINLVRGFASATNVTSMRRLRRKIRGIY